MESDVEAVLGAYPRIYFACHSRHVQDPESGHVLTSRQASFLDHLDIAEPVSLKSLAGHLGVTPATACVTVDRLERLGYVKRTRQGPDRRVVQILLTEAGLRISESNSVLDPARVEAMLGLMGESDRGKAVAGLRILAEAATGLIQKFGSGWSY
ncbi:MAG: winged helix-turn-helix transcriptional regulator [Armatimonadetes bacterium]|nr:winged helix-turn-helix transcriptional regulator [Armatimonadota bacterium]MBS1711418.1 winged helix-turn-helix transcriptional regulator [Armatimonadota bacterium]MBX3107657.1 winged helix-turn-helix transcriptional regulator [Fimbriimonadaceae bacterium]